jgi:WD40 repeat protein
LTVWAVGDTPTLLKSTSHPTPFLGFLGTDDTLVSYSDSPSSPTVKRDSETLWTLNNSSYRFLSTNPNGAVAALSGGDPRWPVLILERDGDSMRQTHTVKTGCEDHLVRLNQTGDQLAIFRDYVERFTLAGEPLPALERGRIVQFNDIAWLPPFGSMIGLVTMHGLRFSKGSEEHLVLWDAASGKQQHSVQNPTRMNFLAVMPDGRQFAEVGTDAMVRLRDADTLAVVHEFRAHDGPITTLACHPTRRILATGSQDLCVRLWNADTGQLLEELRGPIQPPTQLIFSPSGRQIACSVANDVCRLWEPKALNPPEAN